MVEAQDECQSAVERGAALDYSRCLQGPILVVFHCFSVDMLRRSHGLGEYQRFFAWARVCNLVVLG